MTARAAATAAALVAALAPGPAAAATDPMRPTPGVDAPAAPAPAARARPAAAEAARDRAEPRLVSTRVDPDGQRWALIGDRWLQRGDPYDDWTVVEIVPDEVRLARRGERRILRMWPATTATAPVASQRTPRP